MMHRNGMLLALSQICNGAQKVIDLKILISYNLSSRTGFVAGIRLRVYRDEYAERSVHALCARMHRSEPESAADAPVSLRRESSSRSHVVPFAPLGR